MITIPKLWEKLSVRVTIFVAILLFIMLFAFYYLMRFSGEKAFFDVITKSYQDGSITFSNVISNGNKLLICPVTETQLNAINAEPYSFRMKPLSALYLERFESSIFWLSLIGAIGAFAVGYITSRVLLSPLHRVSVAMKELRQNGYGTVIENSGMVELDSVISEYNQLAQELSKVEELRKDLISDTSHELKTPVTSLIAQLEGIKDGVIPFTNDRAVVLLEQVYRLRDLIDQLQEYSALRGGSRKIKKEFYNLNNVIETALSLTAERFKESGIKVQIEIPENLIVKMDKNLMQQIFLNIFENILVHSGATKVNIKWENNNLIISDNGKGVPEDKLTNIFERFYRVDSSRSRKTGGLGLGLAIVKEIVESHGWKISAKTKAGLEFTIEKITTKTINNNQ
jgi:two-component system sensor histidine kinase BaeS